MIQRMLQRLRPMMSGYKPNQQICLAMVKLIEAEEVLAININQVVDAQAFNSAFTATKSSPKKSSPSTMSPSSPSTRWSMVGDANKPNMGYHEQNVNNDQ